VSSPERIAADCARAMYAADVASQALGITVSEVSPGRAVVRMAVTAAMVNGHGIGHGGYVFLLADTAFAFACNTYDERTVAGGAAVEFLRPVRLGDVLVAEAVERHRSGRNGLYDVTVRRLGSGPADRVIGAAVADGFDGEAVADGIDGEAVADGFDGEVVAEFRGRSRSLGGRILGSE
jgi:acyl-CoA thioesterase